MSRRDVRREGARAESGGRPGQCPHQSLDDLCAYLREVGLRAAARRLPRDDVQDCAQGFVAHMLEQLGPEDAPAVCAARGEAWLARCAANYAENERLMLERRYRREISLDGAASVSPASATEAQAMSPEAAALQAELWSHFLNVAVAVTTLQFEYVCRHSIDGERICDMAAKYGKSEHAMAVAVRAAESRWAALLIRTGLSFADIGQYLSACSRWSVYAAGCPVTISWDPR